ncbi:hypothetical protein K8I85_00625, partial [bacterium]|nr:hypothetical protein [bacterium]
APAAVLLAYHDAAYGVWWRGTAGYHGDRGLAVQFGVSLLPGGLVHYGVALLALYPGMLLAFLADREKPLTATLPAIGFTLFYCLYYYREQGADFAETVVTSLRFLVPVLPLFLLSYARVLVRLLDGMRMAPPAIAMVVAALGLAGSTLLQSRHDLHLRAQDERRVALYDATTAGATILCGARARELVHPVWGDRRLESCERQGRWAFPADPGAGELYLALVGGDRRGDAAGVPLPVAELLAACGGTPVARVDEAPRLRVWRLDRDRYRRR